MTAHDKYFSTAPLLLLPSLVRARLLLLAARILRGAVGSRHLAQAGRECDAVAELSAAAGAFAP